MKKLLLFIILFLLPMGVFASDRVLYDMSIEDDTIVYRVNSDDSNKYDIKSYISINNGYFFQVDSKEKNNEFIVNLDNIKIEKDDVIFLKVELYDDNKLIKSSIMSDNPNIQYRYGDNKSMANILVRVDSGIMSIGKSYSSILSYAIVFCCILLSGLLIVLFKCNK